MVSSALLRQAKALSPDDRWELVEALLDTLEPRHSPEELAVAQDGLRQYRANPEATIAAEQVLDELARKYA
jgi:putative addiction module component (TIGR02574 family)